ncbi:MAG: bifunctional 4-hydroxy-2-oxoglutarate aldolase/2-dehydro-3-deoxy-phosphogluconate aldolase [Gaiellales bacterium]
MERARAATAAVVERLREIGVVPIVELREADHGVPLARALVEGGLSCVEITLRTPAAVDGIRAIRVAFPEILLGAGTILSVDQLELALEAGADFAVAPGLNPRVVEASLTHGLPILPGISTPSELEAARELGLRTLKLFPAELLGGAAYVRALCGPYRDVEFVPTGSITPALVPDYLAIPQVVACGGSWMVRPETIAAGNFTQIRALAAEAVAQARAAR